METFNTVKKAFDLADKYQVPVIVLMDQFLADTMQTESDMFDIDKTIERYLKKPSDTAKTPYLRYEFTESGISPRALPCQSFDLVRSGGNEHDPRGHTSEDAQNRQHMVKKRAAKWTAMISEMETPSVFSPESDVILVGWGSLKGSIMEACLELRCQGSDVGWLIFKDIWPMDADKIRPLVNGKKLIMVEANSTAQMGSLILQQTGVRYHEAILQYDGRPVYPEFITRNVKAIMGKNE
jgi:2-oxoglutarate ferredoxin oxidoreductase subunit alpha